MRKLSTTVIACLMVVGGAMSPAAADADEEILTTEKLADGIYVLLGKGGNIGVSVGSDGVFLIDDQFAATHEKLTATVAQLTDQPIRFLLNTHWHGDHTGGNELLGQEGVVILSHDNVRKLLSEQQAIKFFQRTVPASPKAALPVVTFPDAMTLHFNGEQIAIEHVAHAHTNGDSIVHFPESNVLHMGDTFFHGLYPFIDVEHGGSLAGMIAAARRGLALADAQTRIIPGHGPPGDKADLEQFVRMLETVQARIEKLRAQGKSLQEIVAARPTRGFDAANQGFLAPADFVKLVVRGMQSR